jgi:hypothetical protein
LKRQGRQPILPCCILASETHPLRALAQIVNNQVLLALSLAPIYSQMWVVTFNPLKFPAAEESNLFAQLNYLVYLVQQASEEKERRKQEVLHCTKGTP